MLYPFSVKSSFVMRSWNPLSMSPPTDTENYFQNDRNEYQGKRFGAHQIFLQTLCRAIARGADFTWLLVISVKRIIRDWNEGNETDSDILLPARWTLLRDITSPVRCRSTGKINFLIIVKSINYLHVKCHCLSTLTVFLGRESHIICEYLERRIEVVKIDSELLLREHGYQYWRNWWRMYCPRLSRRPQRRAWSARDELQDTIDTIKCHIIWSLNDHEDTIIFARNW